MKKKWLLLLPVLAVYVPGLFIDVMEPDAAQYATMSWEMLRTGNFLEIFHRGQDYIDKPPLIFWSAALSFKLFGPSNFAYKLPSVLFTLLGLFATYRLGKLLYNGRAGYFAVLLLASCQAWFMINQDVRTDTILAACTIAAIWQLAEFNAALRIIHIVYAGLAISGAMLMKGPIGLMVPGLAIAMDYALKRQWKMFFRWEWLLLAAIVLVCLSPMLYGLYQQFDATVAGKDTYNGRITSGLRFYFWTQSFGRLTGESTWKNDADPFFFLHTFLWAFLPWSALFIAALFRRLRKVVQRKFLIGAKAEAVTLGGIIFPLIAFSLSQYKLPHYIFVFFPLAAILTGKYVSVLLKNIPQPATVMTLRIVHAILALSILGLGFYVGAACFPLNRIGVAAIAILGLFLTVFYIFYKGSLFQLLVIPPLIAITTFNFLMNVNVYPNLLTYQSSSRAAQWVRSGEAGDFPLITYRTTYYSLDFYYRDTVPNVASIEDLRNNYRGKTVWIFTHPQGLSELQKMGVQLEQQKKLEDFHVSTLTAEFLNPRTRPTTVVYRYLVLVSIPA